MANTQESTIFVVDDDQAVRDSLQWLISSVGLNVKTFGSARDFLDEFDPSQRGCLIVDVRMPEMSGLELQEKLNELHASLPVIVITGYGDVSMAVRAMRAGAIDFVEKPFNDQSLLDRIHQALGQDEAQRKRSQMQQDVQHKLTTLTAREKQILELVTEGLSNKQIADQLNLSERTVEVHRAKVMSKMDAKNVAELVRMTLLSKESL